MKNNNIEEKEAEQEQWTMLIYTADKESSRRLIKCSSILKKQGIATNIETNGYCLPHIACTYSTPAEEEICDKFLTETTALMPDTEFICTKYKNTIFPSLADKYSIVANKNIEWIDSDGAITMLIIETKYREDPPYTLWDVIKTPEKCFEKLLEETRKGNECYLFSIIWILFNEDYSKKYFALLQPMDKKWLQETDEPDARYILLLGMYKSLVIDRQEFLDKESGEVIEIEYENWIDTPLFENSEEERESLFEDICSEVPDLEYELFNGILLLKLAGVDYTIVLRKAEEFINELYTPDRIAQIEYCAQVFEFIGELYNCGEEKYGYFIDKKKAREYYRIAGCSPEEFKSDEEFWKETYNFKYSLKGNTDNFKTFIKEMAARYGKVHVQPDNRRKLYVPLNMLMNKLAGSDPETPEYQGRLLSVLQNKEALILTVESYNKEPLLYALLKNYPKLTIDIEELPE